MKLSRAAAALSAVALALLFAATRGHGRGRPERYTQLTFQRGTISNARFGADGQTVVFSASWEGLPSRVFVKPPDNPDPFSSRKTFPGPIKSKTKTDPCLRFLSEIKALISDTWRP